MSASVRAKLHAAADAIADAIEAAAHADPADALVPLSADGLKRHGVEYRAGLRLADEGKLRTVTIGRRRFTTMRHLVALVDELPPSVSDADEVTAAARRRARRGTR